MGVLDGLRAWLGLGAEAGAGKAADPEDLFGMSTAHVTMDADLDFAPLERAALCFSGVDSTDFAEALANVESLVEAGDEGTVAESHEDGHGYRWVVLSDPDFEDLVVGVHAAADEFAVRGYDSRLLAAVFGFERRPDRFRNLAADPGGGPERAYWIYSFRRGAYYPFAPRGDQERDHGLEFKLRSVLDGELDVEDDESYWYPLWPDAAGGHPWE
ncbi:MAG: hypothetical protein U5J98_02585 [Halobacteriales archaeon]|nr:hypothetical protein [Halobacteriales archaeon]